MGYVLLASHLLSCCALKRLASRGGRNRSSTRLPVWGVNYEKGACTSPLFHFCGSVVRTVPKAATSLPFRTQLRSPYKEISVSPFTYTFFSTRSYLELSMVAVDQKNERPLGGAAARAWDGGYSNRSPSGSSDRRAALASSKTAQEQ